MSTSPSTARRLLQLPREREAAYDIPTYDSAGPDECGSCIYHRRHPGGLNVPPNAAGLLSTHPDVQLFWSGLGHCTVSPPTPRSGIAGLYPITHVTWSCQSQTTEADLAAAAASAKTP